MDGPLSFSSTRNPAYDPLTSPLEKQAWSCTRSCYGWLISLSIILSRLSFLDKPRSRSANLYLQHFPFLLVVTSLLGQSPRSRSVDLYLWCFLVWRTILFPILLLIVWLFSKSSTYSNLGTFRVHLIIVLSLRKAPIGPVYKPAYVFLCLLASSMHKLSSNLVSSLVLPLVSVPTDFQQQCGWPPRAAALLW